MRISDILKTNKVTVSCEMFPPKPGKPLENTQQVVHEIAAHKPSFMSVTYGAGGSNSKNTLSIAEEVQKSGVTALAHLTCVGQDEENLRASINAFKASGIEFLTTQMFFDNNILYNYMFKLLRHDIRVPVIAGIMPVTNAKQIKRIMSLSSSSMPTRFKAIVDRFANNPEAMKQAGIAYATEQIIDLIANDVTHIHIYTMNRPDIAGSIMTNLSKIIDGYEAE